MTSKKFIFAALAVSLSCILTSQVWAAPSISSVVINASSVRITFDSPTIADTSSGANYSASAANLNNFSLQSPTGTIIPLDSSLGHFANYFVSGGTEGITDILGLSLTASASFTLGTQNIAAYGVVTDVMDAAINTGTVSASSDPTITYIENITGTAGTNSCYGYPCAKTGEQIRIKGANFNVGIGAVTVYGFSSSFTATASDSETVLFNAPTQVAAGGNIQIKVENTSSNKKQSAIKYFAFYSSTCGVIKGALTNSSASVGSDQNNVPIRAESWNTTYAETKSHSNGFWAMALYSNDTAYTGTYDVFYTTPPGASEAAPAKTSSQSVSYNTVTNAGTAAFQTANVTGTIKDPTGSTAISGTTITVHNESWSTNQRSITSTSGAFKAYMPVTSTSNYYTIKAEPLNFYKSSAYNYQNSSTNITIAQNSSSTNNNINLTSKNVIGVVKTPTGTTSDSNPSPDTAVPNANIGLHTSTWSWNQWTSTDSSGAFEFGGVPAGSDYVLEIEVPWGNVTFGGYSRTSFTSLTVATSGVTNLGTKRFQLPNFYGTVLAGGSEASGVYVSLNKEGFGSSTNTDSSGKFRFAISTSGTYNFRVEAPSGYANYETTVDITSSDISSGKNLGNISLAAPNVTGYVYNSAVSAGVQYVSIDICPYMNPGRCYWAETNASGYFGVGTVPNGTWQISLRTRSWIHTEAAPSSTILTISGGVLTGVGSDTTADATAPFITGPAIKLSLVDPATNGLKGVIYGPTGSVGQQANLSLRTFGSYGTSQWAESDSSGQFAFGSVAAGTYELEVNPNWGSSFSRKNYTITVDSSGNVTGDGVTALGVRNIVLRLSSPNITGTLKTPVYNSAYAGLEISQLVFDQPVQWGWINLHTAGSAMGPGDWYGTNTNESGVFSLGGVKAGTYIVEYSPTWGSAFSMVSETITVSAAVAAGTESLNLNTSSSRASAGAVRLGLPQLRGTVKNPSGTVVQNVYIMVYDSSHTTNKGSNTDSSGQFTLGGLSDGTYSIEVNMPWGQGLVAPSGLSVVVSSDVGVIKQNGTNLTDNIITLQEPTKTITGWVKKSGTTAVANARVEAHKDMGGGFVEARTNSSGVYSLKVSGGSWWVETRPDWGSDIDWVNTESMTKVTFTNNDSTQSETVNFSVSATDATVTGYIKYPNGTAANNCWVNLCQGKGMCMGRNTDSTGRFSVKVTAGTYQVMAFPGGGSFEMSGTQYGSPDPKTVSVGSGQTTDAGTLTLKTKNSSIKGRVQDASGNAVSNVVVNAWEYNGPGWAMSFSDSTGEYTLNVFGGTTTAKKWGVMAMPMSTQYIYQGAPLVVEVLENETDSDNNFVLKIADATIKGNVRLNSTTGNVVTDIFGGVWVRDPSLGMLDFGGVMEDMMSNSGMMGTGGGGTMNSSTGTGAPMGGGMEKGGMGTGLWNGAFEVKVPAGTYEVGIGMPPGSSYTLDSAQTVTVASNSTETVDLIVKQNDATVSGTFFLDADNDDTYDSGEEVTGVRATVHADRTGGGWQMTESNTNGTYSLNVSAGTWYLNSFIDPFMTMSWTGTAFGNKYMIVSEDQSLTITAGSTSTLNFEVKELNAVITGTILNPNSTAMTEGSVWVYVDYGSSAMLTEFKGPGGPGLGAFSDPVTGAYSLSVPAGTFKVGAGIPPWDTRDLINPQTTTVTVAANETSANHNLQFKESNATLSGTVTLSGSNQACYVRAWSALGGSASQKSTDGTFSLNITQADTWYVKAAAEISSALYESSKATVTTVNGTTSYTQNLTLASKNLTIPDSKTASFSATSTKTIRLDDGLIVDIPSGAIDTSGTITVTVTPTVDVSADSDENLVGYAYSFEAKDSNGQEITEFVQNVTITMPYDEDVVSDMGIAEESLTPKYYDETTNTWENYDAVVRDATNNQLIIKTDHFSDGGPVGGEVPDAPSGLRATAASSYQINLSWTDNSDDETGFKVYRNSSNSSWESATLITTTVANATSYNSTGLTQSTLYYYRVKATNAEGDSTWSGTASATTQSAGGVVPIYAGGGGGNEPPAAEEEEVPKEIIIQGEIPTVTFEKPISEMSIAELKAKIVEIQQVIIQLQALLAQFVPTGYSGIPSGFTFDRVLKQGETSDEVKYLQIILKAEIGAPIYPSDIGATGWFGSITKTALIAFQEKYAADILAPWDLTEGTGYLGKTTREKLNALLGI